MSYLQATDRLAPQQCHFRPLPITSHQEFWADRPLTSHGQRFALGWRTFRHTSTYLERRQKPLGVPMIMIIEYNESVTSFSEHSSMQEDHPPTSGFENCES